MFYRNRINFVMLNVECLSESRCCHSNRREWHPPFDLYQLGAVHLAGCGVSGINLCSSDTASRDHAFPSGLLATPTMVSKMPRGQCVYRVKCPYYVYFQTLNENIFWLSLRYNRYNLYRITWFCNKNKKPRTDHVALSVLIVEESTTTSVSG